LDPGRVALQGQWKEAPATSKVWVAAESESKAIFELLLRRGLVEVYATQYQVGRGKARVPDEVFARGPDPVPARPWERQPAAGVLRAIQYLVTRGKDRVPDDKGEGRCRA
jgi:hypothetical protein